MVTDLSSLARAIREDAPTLGKELELNIKQKKEDIEKALAETGEYTLQIEGSSFRISRNDQR